MNFEPVVHKLLKKYDKLIILRDFNINFKSQSEIIFNFKCLLKYFDLSLTIEVTASSLNWMVFKFNLFKPPCQSEYLTAARNSEFSPDLCLADIQRKQPKADTS